MSMAELARRAGIDKNTVFNTESGATKPTGGTLAALSRGLDFNTWEEVIASVEGPRRMNGFGGAKMIPVLAEIPATHDIDGEVHGAFEYEDAIDWMPASYGDADDPNMFGLVVRGDSMGTEFPDGSQVTCSPKHWNDHGFIEGEVYAVRLVGNGTTIKRVHLVDDRGTIDLIPANPDHPTKRYDAKEIALAALVRGVYRPRVLPKTD